MNTGDTPPSKLGQNGAGFAGFLPSFGRAAPLVGLVIGGIGGIVLSVAIASGPPILAARWGILWRLAGWTGCWALATASAVRLPRRLSVGLVLLIGIGLRVAALAGPPTLSDDLYRYSWDGRVQAAGIDPYDHAPDHPALLPLRESWLWPDAAGCADIKRPPGCTRINRPSSPTIYPPVAEAYFAAIYQFGGIGSHHKLWQVAGLGVEAVTLGLIPLALVRWGRDPRWAALYALSPLPVLEAVNNGHVDGLAVLLVVTALFVAAPRAATVRVGVAGALLGAAALVKLHPALLLLALVGVIPSRSRTRTLLMGGLAAATVGIIGYLPHVLAVGPKVLGYLPGYLKEEHYDAGGRFLLAGLLTEPLGLPPAAAGVVAGAGLLAALAWVVIRRPPMPVGAALLAGALLLATTPVQPWYAVVLLAVATVAARPRWAALAVAGYPSFFAVLLDHPHPVAIGRASYGAAALIVGVLTVRQHRRHDDTGREEEALPAMLVPA